MQDPIANVLQKKVRRETANGYARQKTRLSLQDTDRLTALDAYRPGKNLETGISSKKKKQNRSIFGLASKPTAGK